MKKIPSERPSIEEVKDHPFFADIRWIDVHHKLYDLPLPKKSPKAM